MTIPCHLIPNVIGPSSELKVEVRYEHDRTLAMTVCRREALMLAAEMMVLGEVNKRNHLRYLVLVVSVRAALRMLKRLSRNGRSIAAEDNYTVSHKPGPNGGTYSHNRRSFAYGGQLA